MANTKVIASAVGTPNTRTQLSTTEQNDYDTRLSNFIAASTARKASEERDWRDEELKDTDVYGLSDRVMSVEMSTYRQELRDMPALAGFPDSHTRPTRPAGE